MTTAPLATARIATGLAKIAFGMLAVGALLCLTAWNWTWGAAWLLALVTALSLSAMALGLARRNPALFAERQRVPFRGTEQPLWDKLAIVLIFATMGLWLFIPGFDVHRWGISHMPLGLQVFGVFGVVAGIRVMYLALVHNSNLLPNVEVRDTARLATTGPYAWVRHPYYAGFVLFYASASLMLGSWLALAWSGIIATVFAGRLIREEAVLIEEMEGYAAYRSTTRFRLIPGIW